MSRRTTWGVAGLLVMALLLETACRVGPFGSPQVSIQGVVAGEQVGDKEQGKVVLVSVSHATITCNGSSTTSATDGSYTLTLDQSSRYSCAATAPPNYVRATATIAAGTSAHMTLDFNSMAFGTCTPRSPADVRCGGLTLASGTLAGTVMFADGRGGVANAQVQCRDLTDPTARGQLAYTDAGGTYELTGLPASAYWCLALTTDGRVQAQRVSIAPNSTTSQAFTICESACPFVAYHTGTVMHAYRAYVIFWVPAGDRFEPGGSDARYESLVERYLRDVGGTAFYGLLEQYYDFAGPVLDQATLAGAYVDRTRYVHCGVLPGQCTPTAASQADPLLDLDIQAEVTRVSVARGWKPDGNTEFIVLTAAGAQVCGGEVLASGIECTFVQNNHAVCGWHNTYTDSSGTAVTYALIADPLTAASGGCNLGEFPQISATSPNGDWAADSAIDIISHEQFESVTDPQLDGWYVTAEKGPQGEIGDLCETAYPNVGPDGGDVTLSHGDRYLVQAEWSDAANGCALS